MIKIVKFGEELISLIREALREPDRTTGYFCCNNIDSLVELEAKIVEISENEVIAEIKFRGAIWSCEIKTSITVAVPRSLLR